MLDNIWNEARSAWDSFRWSHIDSFAQGAEPERITMMGLPGAGKRTLLRGVLGWQPTGDVDSSPELVHDFGLFSILDVPQNRDNVDTVLYTLEDSAAVIYLIDAAVGMQPADWQWIARLRTRKAALLLVLNKADQVQNVAEAQAVLEQQLSRPVLPLSALDAEAVQTTLVEALIKACPQVMVPLGAQVAGWRHAVAARLIRQAALLSLVFALEPLPLLDVTVLLGLQIHLVNRLSALYACQGGSQARWEIGMTVAFGLLVRYGAETLSKFVPYGGWLVSGIIGASGTWAVGQAAVAYYESEVTRQPLGGQLAARVRHAILPRLRR